MGSWSGADLLTNQRAAPRVVFHHRGKLLILAQGFTFPIKTLDISASGIGLMSPDPIPANQTCTVEIMTLHQGQATDFTLKGTVAYCILAGTQGFRVGIQYTEVDPASQSVINRLVSSAR